MKKPEFNDMVVCGFGHSERFAANSTKEDEMGDHGNRDKGGREQKKKAKLSLKEKRKQKQEKKQNINVTTI